MPITLDTAHTFHPLELTRQHSPEIPTTAGTFSLAELCAKMGFEPTEDNEASEAEVLAIAARAGHAFFKTGDNNYVSFCPQLGELDSESNNIAAIELTEVVAAIELTEVEDEDEDENPIEVVEDDDPDNDTEGELGDDFEDDDSAMF